jgi:hypothetical protein
MHKTPEKPKDRIVDGHKVVTKEDYDKQMKDHDDKILEGSTMAANANAAKEELHKGFYAVSGKMLAAPGKNADGTWSMPLDSGTLTTGIGGCYVEKGGVSSDLTALKTDDEVELFVDGRTGMVARCIVDTPPETKK